VQCALTHVCRNIYNCKINVCVYKMHLQKQLEDFAKDALHKMNRFEKNKDNENTRERRREGTIILKSFFLLLYSFGCVVS